MAKALILKHLDLVRFDDADYLSAETLILKNLRGRLEDIQNSCPNPSPAYGKIRDAIDEIQLATINLESSDGARILFHQKPSLWQNTSRVSRKIGLEKDEKISAFNIVEKKLKEFRRIDFLFNTHLNEAWAEIRLAKINHETLRKKAKRQFLFQAKNDTATQLISKLEAAGFNRAEHPSWFEELDTICALKSYDETPETKKPADSSLLETSKDCLIANRDVDLLATKLKEITIDDKNSEIEIHELAVQLDEVTKRWIDPHFRRPAKLTTVDRARFAFKIIIGVLASLCAAAAIIFLFTPLAPLAPIMGLAGLIGLASLTETGVSAIYHKVRYKRNLLRIQAGELIAALVILPLMIITAQISNFFHAIPAFLKSLSDGVREYGMHAFGVAANSAAIGVITGIWRGITRPRVRHTDDLKKHHVIAKESAREIMIKTVTPSTQKASSLSEATQSLWGKNSVKKEKNLPPKVNSFLFKDSQGGIHERGSHYDNIKSELALYKKNKDFSVDFANKVQAYLDLQSGESLSKRLVAIDEIGNDITDNKRSDLNIVNFIVKEKHTLDKIKSYLPGDTPLKENKKAYAFDDENNQKENQEGHLILSR
jgi:hypothetical protein